MMVGGGFWSTSRGDGPSRVGYPGGLGVVLVVPGEVPTTRTLATPAGTIPGAGAMMVGEGQALVTKEGEAGAMIGGGAEAGTGAAGKGQGPVTGRGPRGQGAGQGSARKRSRSRDRKRSKRSRSRSR